MIYQLVPGHEPAAAILGSRPSLSPHGTHLHDLREVARGAEGGAPPSAQRRVWQPARRATARTIYTRMNRWSKNGSRALWAGLESLGLELLVPEEYRAVRAALTTVRIPDGVNDAALRSAGEILLNDFGIEIGGGLGAFKGKAWRIGLMGYNSSPMNPVLALLSALEQLLPKQDSR